MTAKIKCQQLTKTFSNTLALDNITCSIEEKKITAILGRNGSGKTTLIKLMLNMLSPSSGQVYYNNEPVEKLGVNLYKRTAAVLEGVDNLYDYMTGMENIDYFLGLQGVKLSTIHSSLEELLHRLRLNQAIHQKCGSYSRGMKQKLSLVIALMTEADILFLDEPTLGLDFESYQLILETLQWLVKEKSKTIILTSHQAALIEAVADRVILLDSGKMLFSGTLSEFKQSSVTTVGYVLKYQVDGGEITNSKKIEDYYQISFSEHRLLANFLQDHPELLPFIHTIEERNNDLDDVLSYFYEVNQDDISH